MLRVFHRVYWSARLCANSSFKPTAEVGLGFSDKQPRGGGLIQVLGRLSELGYFFFQRFALPSLVSGVGNSAPCSIRLLAARAVATVSALG